MSRVHASINYTGPMSERPRFHANDQSLDRVLLDARVVPIDDARSADRRPTLAREGFALHACPQRLAVDQGHDVVRDHNPFDGDRPGIDQAENAGMRELRGDADFPKETLREHLVGDAGVENLDGHRALMFPIARSVDGGHAAGTQDAFDIVGAGERRVELIDPEDFATPNVRQPAKQ